MATTDVIQVQYHGEPQPIPIGRLAFQERRIFFEYDSAFLRRGLEFSPLKLPLRSGLHVSPNDVFEGLFGLFNDSLPDGWGRLLVDRSVSAQGIHPKQLTPLDRLRRVGSGGMGALSYHPEILLKARKNPSESRLASFLDRLAQEAEYVLRPLQSSADQSEFEEGEIDDLLAFSGSSAGARPKVIVRYQSGVWMVKFRAYVDASDVGCMEYAYHLMAISAGLTVPPALIFPSKQGSGHFGSQLFDRSAHCRKHVHSLSGLLHADHRTPSLDYEAIFQVTQWLTRDAQEVEKQFRNAVFNVLAHNRDDHSKNFSFVMNPLGKWSIAPAYDLTFSFGPGGEHCTTVLGEGKQPTRQHLMQLAQKAAIPLERADLMIDEVSAAVAQWKSFAKQAGVSRKSAQLVDSTIASVYSTFMG